MHPKEIEVYGHCIIKLFFRQSTFQNAKDQNTQHNSASFTCGCEKWILILREEHKLQVSGNKI
jgi:hypothetical protein